jgi:hypothetical protein
MVVCDGRAYCDLSTFIIYSCDISSFLFFLISLAQETNEPGVCRKEGCKLCIMNNCLTIKYVYKDVLTSCMSLCTLF